MNVSIHTPGAIAALARQLAAAGAEAADGGSLSSWIEVALRVLECACEIVTNRLYLLATGRLLVLVYTLYLSLSLSVSLALSLSLCFSLSVSLSLSPPPPLSLSVYVRVCRARTRLS